MFISDLLTAFFVATFLSCVVFAVFRREKNAGQFVWFFFFMLLVTWAGGIWVRPFGPKIGQTHWVSFVIIGIINVLIFITVSRKKPPSNRHETLDMLDRIEKEKEFEKITFFSLSTFFGLLLAILIFAIIFNYV